MPELWLLALALPLELLWEMIQFPLYDVWRDGPWSYILYGLAHCTIGDLLILLACYELVAVVRRERRWWRHSPFRSGVAFTMLGIGYTVFSEIYNVRIQGTWGYTDSMPIMPLVGIGAAPFLQWVFIPPLVIWFMARKGKVG